MNMHRHLKIKSIKIAKKYIRQAETDYLLQNPVMAKRLLDAVGDVKKGKVSTHLLTFP